MTRIHIGMLIILGGALLFALAYLARRRSDRPGAGRILAVLSIVIWFAAILSVLAGFGVAVSSAVFP